MLVGVFVEVVGGGVRVVIVKRGAWKRVWIDGRKGVSA